MSIWSFVFNSIARFPLIGPDDDFEAELLLCGQKPIGLFVDFLPNEHVTYSASAIRVLEKIRSDIIVLDRATKAGRLKKQQFGIEDQHGKYFWNFYCQPKHEPDMYETAEWHHAQEEDREPQLPVSKPCGEYFGYSKADIWLFDKGGYASLPKPVANILRKTHDFRRKCRIAQKLNTTPFDLY